MDSFFEISINKLIFTWHTTCDSIFSMHENSLVCPYIWNTIVCEYELSVHVSFCTYKYFQMITQTDDLQFIVFFVRLFFDCPWFLLSWGMKNSDCNTGRSREGLLVRHTLPGSLFALPGERAWSETLSEQGLTVMASSGLFKQIFGDNFLVILPWELTVTWISSVELEADVVDLVTVMAGWTAELARITEGKDNRLMQELLIPVSTVGAPGVLAAASGTESEGDRGSLTWTAWEGDQDGRPVAAGPLSRK